MEVPIIISAAIFIAVVPAPSLTQYHGAHAVPWPLLLAKGAWRMQRTPQYGHDLYGGQSYGDEFPHAGADFLDNRYNGMNSYDIDASGIGETKHWNRARLGTAHGTRGNYVVMPSYAIDGHLDSMDMPAISQGRRSLRRKRSPREEEELYDGKSRRHRRRQRHRRKNWERLYDGRRGGPAEDGTALVKLNGCPRASGPIRLNLRVSPNK